MKRSRALAALLACLAILASGATSVAAAAPVGAPAPERSSANTPCSHCPDCDGVPCSLPAADCVQAPGSVSPALGVAAVDLAQPGSVLIRWMPRNATLSGLSRPPDPFPPRT